MAGAALSSLRADFVAGAALSLGLALAVARCTFGDCKVNPLRALGGSKRSRCGALHIFSTQSEPSARICVGRIALAEARLTF